MTRQIGRLATVCALGLAGLSGCTTSARYVTVTSNAGVVAIPSNSNAWPEYYRQHAEELMQAKCPGGYVIEREERFATGTSPASDRAEWRIFYRQADAPPGSSLALAVQRPAAEQPFPVQQAVGLTPTTPPAMAPSTIIAVPGMQGLQSGRTGIVPPGMPWVPPGQMP